MRAGGVRIAVATALLSVGLRFSPALEPIAVLAPSDVPAGYTNEFGSSVAISGNYLVVGAPRDPWFSGLASGAAYVFRRQGPVWIEQAKLTALDTDWEHQLGSSVAIDGDVVVVGAPHYFPTYPDDGGPGAAYVFRRDHHGTPNDPSDDTWPLSAKLTAPHPAIGQLFGISVAVDGDAIVVGKPRVGDSAEVFRWKDRKWTHEATLVGSDTQPYDHFGWSVDFDGDHVVVGAWAHDERQGASYVFRREGVSWLEEAKLMAGDRSVGNDFGYSVSISGDSVVVGAPGDDDAGSSTGSVYCFFHKSPGEWVKQEKILPAGPSSSDTLGFSVSIDGGLFVTGRYGDLVNPWAWLYGRGENGWSQVGPLQGIEFWLPPPVAIDGNYAAVANWIFVVHNGRSLRDYAAFQRCIGKTGTGRSETCRRFDKDGDGSVGLADYEVFVGTWIGPQR